MEYTVVELGQRTIAGISARTSNEDPKMGVLIGDLWTRLYQGGEISKINNRADEYAVGLYSDYSKDGSYEVTVGCQVKNLLEDEKRNELTYKTLPAGKYAKFEIHGDMQQAVCNAWGEIWQMNLERTYTGDYEEYVDNCMENATIYIYIAIK